MDLNYLDAFVGWSVGYSYTNGKFKEDEVAQGGNYYLASMPQVIQMSNVAMLLSQINEKLPAHRFSDVIKPLCNIIPLFSFPAFVYCAAVKQGQHESLAEKINDRLFLVRLPEKLNGRVVSCLSFVAEHAGDFFRIAMVAASIALIVLGNVAYGSAVLAALTIDIFDTLGFIPRRISLWMELYMPTVSDVGLLIGGIPVTRAIAAVSLLSTLSPRFVGFLHRKVDACFRALFSTRGPSLKEIDANVVERKKMTYEEINEILESDASDFKLNPAHCSHSALDIEKLPKDYDFKQFLTLFNEIDWVKKYSLVRGKLKDDERFMQVLLKKFPGQTLETLKLDFDSYIEKLAAQKKMDVASFAAHWMREQMVILTEVLQGKRRIKGSQQDLDEAIHDCAIILPRLKASKDLVEKEDALAKLAIEGGDYCGRGLKRAANEMVRLIVKEEDKKTAGDDAVRNYELRVLQALQNRRQAILHLSYKRAMDKYKIPKALSKDTHVLDIFNIYLSLGFYPLSEYERNRVGVLELSIWQKYKSDIMKMYKMYRNTMDDEVVQLGNVHFGNYIPAIINENDLLTAEQKGELLYMFTDCNDGAWTKEETLQRFRNLMYVRLGILIPKF